MIEEFQIDSAKSTSEINFSLKNELSDRGYKRLWSFLNFGLKLKFNLENKSEQSEYYFKTILFFIPVWYLVTSVEMNQATRKTRIQMFYYSKGLKLLDIFRISKRWQTEFAEIQKKYAF